MKQNNDENIYSGKTELKPKIIVNGYAYPSISGEVLNQWLPDLTFLSSFSYGITEEGGLIGLQDDAVVTGARDAGVESLMVITPLNAQGQFSNELAKHILENRLSQDALLENMLNTLETKGMIGVDFDFEYVYAMNKKQYVDFVARATQLLNSRGYLVTVALAPKVSEDQIGLLYEGHDYKGMGEAANYVLLMTYEWGYTFGPPMAVAPVQSVRKVLEYAVSEIPPEKILMGIANYGYDWTLPYIQGSSRAEKLPLEEALERAARYEAKIEFDEIAKSPYYYYTDIDGRRHVVWYEDWQSWNRKFELVKEYGFAGISIWNIMNYSEAGGKALIDNFDIVKVNEPAVL